MARTAVVIGRVVMSCDVDHRRRFDRQITTFKEERFFLPFEDLYITRYIYRPLPRAAAERAGDHLVNVHPPVIDLDFGRSSVYIRRRGQFRHLERGQVMRGPKRGRTDRLGLASSQKQGDKSNREDMQPVHSQLAI
jgi:hypothetical protein